MFKRMYFSLLLLFISCQLLFSQVPNKLEPIIHTFDLFVEKELQNKKLVGLSAAFSFKDITWSKGYGFADLENNVPVTDKSRFRLASISKPISAAGIIYLVQEGKINLDDEVQKYVPYFPKKNYPVTIRHLLGHLAGISHYKNYTLEAGTTEQMDTKQALDIFKDWDLLFEPGTRYQYTTYGYNLLGAVIEGATNQSYEDFMRENVWNALNMNTMSVDHLFRIIPNRVSGYRRINGEIQNTRPVNTSLKIAGGGTIATTLDLVNFADGLSEGNLLDKKYLDMMWTPMVLTNEYQTGYGMGWSVSNFNGHFLVSHGGSQEGTRTFLMHLPAIDLTVAITSNLEESNPREFAYYLASLLLEEPYFTAQPYFADQKDRFLYKSTEDIFKSGSAYFEYNQEAQDKNKADFSYFNELINLDSLSVLKKRVERANHPVSGWTFRKIGSKMADYLFNKLTEQESAIIFKEGSLTFFNKYLENMPNNYPAINEAWKTKISDWHSQWQHFRDLGLLNVELAGKEDINKIVDNLEDNITGYTFYPDYSEQISQVIRDLIFKNEISDALEYSRKLTALYPKSALANSSLAIAMTLNDNEDEAKNYFTRAINIDSGSMANQSNLNWFAYQLAGENKVEQGLKILNIAREMNPDVANLYDSTAEFYLMLGDTTKSISFYKKALEIDPEFSNAKKMLQQFEVSLK